jgi:citrate lyase subunit beta-like protein
LNKIASLGVDCAVLDLEDGVALSEKGAARNLIAQMLDRGDLGKSERAVRINARSSGLQKEDLECIRGVISRVDSILLSKVETLDELREVDSFLTKHDPTKRIKFLAAVESAKGILNLKEICESPRLEALIFASEDYCADVGATRTPSGIEMLYARSALVTYAIAHQLQAIDMVCIQFKDSAQLKRECIDGFNMGYTGKQAIHPDQIPIIKEHFRPPQEKIDFAIKVLVQSRNFEKVGKGAFEVDGKVIDKPMILQARRTMERAGLDPDPLADFSS